MMHRRRSGNWWAVLCFAFMATGAHIAFDVLDIDGSDLRGRPANGMVVAEPARTEAEVRLRHDHVPPDFLAPGTPPSAWQAVARFSSPAPRMAMPAAARRGRFFPRVDVRREVAPPSSSSDDPA